jgi:hypothetical protein
LRQDIQYIEKFEISDLQLKLDVDKETSSSSRPPGCREETE